MDRLLAATCLRSRSASSAKSIIMIAFFFTMPMSRTMPMSAMTLNSVPRHDEREERADAGRGQRREDRDRVDVALVEDAEHDVDGDERGEDQDRLARERVAERLRRALESAVHARRRMRAAPSRRRSPRPRRRATRPAPTLNESVTAGNCPWWLTASGAARSSIVRRTRDERHRRRPSARGRRCARAPRSLLRSSGFTSRIDAVQIELREDGRDLALAEGVVERVVDAPAARRRGARRCRDRS